MIDSLKAVHSSENMIGYAKKTRGMYRSDAIDSTHPVVRVHPVSGEKSLFLNKEFLKMIVGLKESEEQVLVKFLMDHVISGHDFQARVSWEKNSLVMFDGRSTLRECSWVE